MTWTPPPPRAGHPYYMHDAIYAQPGALRLVTRGQGELIAGAAARLKTMDRMLLSGIGTSWHATLVGELLMAHAGRLGHRARAFHSFEFKSYWPEPDARTGVIVVSHRGSKRYSVEALAKAWAGGGVGVAIPGKGAEGLASADYVLRTVDQEKSAAHAVSYTCPLALLAALAAAVGDDDDLAHELLAMPDHLALLLGQESWAELAARFADRRRYWFVGGGPNAATAYEAALKMSEANHATALGFGCEQFLHGPWAALEPDDVVGLQRSPGAMEELLAAEAERGRMVRLAHLQRRFVRRGRVGPTAHEPVSPAVGEGRGELGPGLLAEEQRELIGPREELVGEVVVVTDRRRERGEEGERARVAHRVRGGLLLVDGAQDVVGRGEALGALAGDRHPHAAAGPRLGERLDGVPLAPAVAHHDHAGPRVGLGPVALELERVEGARAVAETARVGHEQLADEGRVPRGPDTREEHAVHRLEARGGASDQLALAARHESEGARLGVDRVVHVVRVAGARWRRGPGHRTGSSLPCGRKRGRALLAERAGALADVRVHEREHLERERLVEDRPGLPQPVVERALRPPDRELAALGEPGGHVQRLRQDLRGWDAEAHEGDALGLAAVEEVGGEQVVLRLRHSAEERPDDRRVVTGRDAEARVAVGQARGLRDDADVGEQRDDQARADCGAVDRRHHRLVEVDHVVDEGRRLAHGARGRVGVPRHLLDEREVATGGEGPTRAGDERHAHPPVGVHGQPHLGELPVQARVRRLHHLRSVDRDQEHPVRRPLEV